MAAPTRVALYARVSTGEQTSENQLIELRRYAAARGWIVHKEFTDTVSGSVSSRPALDQLEQDARRRRFDLLVVWRLDRLGRNLRHLIMFLDEMTAIGVGFVSLAEAIDTSTPAGRLQLHILGAIAEFERCRIGERVKLGIARARAQGRHLGRPRLAVSDDRLVATSHLSVREAARTLKVSKSFIARWRLSQKSA